jgi:hypothetical protein
MLGVAALIGFAAFVGVSLTVGTRLLLLARRTREVPELAIGGALFAGGLGYALFIAAFSLRLLPDALLRPAHFLAVLGLDLGIVSLCLGVWQIFRPSRHWAEGVFAVVAVALTVHLAVSVAHFQPSGQRSPFVFWVFNAIGAGAYLWATFECLRYQGLLRRRARLGLIDAELVNRFLLWGVASACGFLLFGAGMLNRLTAVGGVNPLALALQPFFGLVGAICIWLAFFPPAFYLRRALRREA